MIAFDNYATGEAPDLYPLFPRVIVLIYPARFGRWAWETFVDTGGTVRLHWEDYDGSKRTLTRALRAATLVGHKVEQVAQMQQLQGSRKT